MHNILYIKNDFLGKIQILKFEKKLNANIYSLKFSFAIAKLRNTKQ